MADIKNNNLRLENGVKIEKKLYDRLDPSSWESHEFAHHITFYWKYIYGPVSRKKILKKVFVFL